MKSRMIVKQVQDVEKIMKSGVQRYTKVKMSDDAQNYVVLTFELGDCPYALGDVVDVVIETKLAARQDKLPGISPLTIEIPEEVEKDEGGGSSEEDKGIAEGEHGQKVDKEDDD